MEKNNTSIIIEECNGKNDIQHSISKAAPKILIASPSVFAQNEKQINALKEKYPMFSVGLIYSFQHPDSLAHFDALIYMNDPTEQIQATIDQLLKMDSNRKNNSAPSESLTKREKEILKLLVKGNTTKQIANLLHISTHTVNAHRKNIMRKLDIKTLSGLTIYAVLNNIISLTEA